MAINRNLPWDGQLNNNTLINGLTNLLIVAQMITDRVDLGKVDNIYSHRIVDGTQYGDTYVVRSDDGNVVHRFDPLGVSYSVLTKFFPKGIVEQPVVINDYRQIANTGQQFLVKAGFDGPGKFGEFMSGQIKWMSITQGVWQRTKFTSNIIVGANEFATIKGELDLRPVDTDIKGIQKINYQSQQLLRKLSDVFKVMEEPSTKYNELKMLRNYFRDDFDIVVPIGILSEITHLNIPFLFRPSGELRLKEVHPKYWGKLNEEAGKVGANNKNIRALDSFFYDKDGKITNVPSEIVHSVFAGDLLPEGAEFNEHQTYIARYEDDVETINWDKNFPIQIIHKKDFPIMSSMSVFTSWYNPQSQDETTYLTFGSNSVLYDKLAEYPTIVYEAVVEAE